MPGTARGAAGGEAEGTEAVKTCRIPVRVKRKGGKDMIKVYYEEYHNDFNRKQHVREFPNLDSLEEWIFDQMRTDYTKDRYVMGIPTPEIAERIHSEAPWRIEFMPERGGATFWIRQMKENGQIIFSDGTMTAGRKHWTNAVKEWCIGMEERRENPSFDFAEDEPAEKPAVKPKRPKL